MWQAFDRVERLAASGEDPARRRGSTRPVHWKRKGYPVARPSSWRPTRGRRCRRLGRCWRRRSGWRSSRRSSGLCGRVSCRPRRPSWSPARSRSHPTRRIGCWSWRRRRRWRRCKRRRCGPRRRSPVTRCTRGSAGSARLVTYTDAEGAWNFHARGTVDDGAEFVKVFEPIVDQFFKAALQGGTGRADRGLCVRRVHRAGPPRVRRRCRRGEEVEVVGAAAARPRARRPRRAACVGRSRVTRCARSPASARSRSRVARDLLGDAVVKLVITKGVDVANVTHLGRGPTVAQKIALWWQTPQCTELDCTRVQRDPVRPPRGMDQDPPHPARRGRRPLRPPPRLEDLLRLGARRRHRQTTDGAARRPPPPQEQAEVTVRERHGRRRARARSKSTLREGWYTTKSPAG